MLRIVHAGLLVTAAWGMGSRAASDTPAAPPPPKQYDVEIRYRNVVGRTERLTQYFAMTRYLKSIGFVIDPNQDDDPRDPNETRLRGRVASSVDRKLFFLEPHVQALLLMPTGYKLPEETDALVKVQLELASGLPAGRQRVFADQVRAKLGQLGFLEAVGYDHRGNTRLLGLVPAGELTTLLKDLRWQPSGWLAPDQAVAELPAPLNEISPIRVTEVLPEPKELPAPKGWGPAPERVTVDAQQKISPELRELAGRDDAKRERLELFLTYAPGPDDRDWQRLLTRTAPGLVIEGRLRTMVTVVAAPQQALTLAELPIVSGIRLPRPAVPAVRPAVDEKGGHPEALRASGLERWHAQGNRGKGVRVAVIDGDFRGYERFRGKQLPAEVRFLDLTAERNSTLEPDPFPGDAAAAGSGTQCALAVALAAPEAEITLVRIDPAAPHQLEAAARLIHGEAFFSESIAQRNAELQVDARNLRQRRAELLQERKAVFNDFSQDENAIQRRTEHFKKQAELERDEKAWQERQSRFLDLLQRERDLNGIQVVTSSLVWESGYPVDGGNPLSQYFSDNPSCKVLWFQSAGNARGQTWAGLFRDADGNGVMEFAPAASALLQGRWTRELNFLAWQPHGKERTLELPEKGKLRLSIQWREAHDPSLFHLGEDVYRKPLADLRLVVLRQRDPSGAQVAADEFDVAARSTGLPQRLDNQPASAIYEQVVEFTADPAGRYAVRLEGRLPDGSRPTDVPTLPAQRVTWEMWPRLSVEVVDGPSRLAGRAVFLDYPTALGGLGAPADAQSVYTVGAANPAGQAQPYSTSGPPLNRELLIKPNLLAYDGWRWDIGGAAEVYGSDLATPFAAGLTAAVLSAGTPTPQWQRFLHMQRGSVLRLP